MKIRDIVIAYLGRHNNKTNMHLFYRQILCTTLFRKFALVWE